MAKDIVTVVCIDGDVLAWEAFRHVRAGLVRSGGERVALPDGEPEAPTAVGPPNADTVLALAPADVLLRVLRLPTTETEEIKGMVELQVDRVSPFPVEQTVAGHELLRADEDGVTVCLAIARKAVIEARRRHLAGPDPIRVDAAMLGLWDGLRRDAQVDTDGNGLLFVASSDAVQVIVHQGGVPTLLVTIAGPYALAEAGDREEIARETARLFWTLDHDAGDEAGFTGTVWADPEVGEALAEVVGRHCGFACTARDEADLPSVCEGVARRTQGGGGLDLTPPAWRSGAETARFRRRLLAGVVVLLALWTLLVGGGYGTLVLQRRDVAALRHAEQEWLVPANRVRNLRRRVTTIARYTAREDSALEALREIAIAQPQGIDLDAFTYRRGEAVDIAGLADNTQLILNFNAALNRSELFENVVSGPRVQTRGGRYRFSFELVLPGGNDDG